LKDLCDSVSLWFVIACATPIAAHHSWTADYDGGKPVSVKGVVTKVEWTNPHTHFYVEAKDEKGTVTMWNFEMASTLALERAGWSRKTLQAGQEVTITGFGGRAVTQRAIAQTITTADGKALFAGKLGQ
jgi:DNA/RNA endonuclease YhcR with UshA esterase domain